MINIRDIIFQEAAQGNWNLLSYRDKHI